MKEFEPPLISPPPGHGFKRRSPHPPDFLLLQSGGKPRLPHSVFGYHIQPWTRDGSPFLPGKILDIAEYNESILGGISGESPDEQDAEERVFKVHKPVRDLLHAEIDYSQNILGNFFLERGHYTVIVGPSGIGKSMVAVQMAVGAAAGLHVFGMPNPGSLRVVLVQAEDSDNDLKLQARCIETIAHSEEVQERLGLTPEDCNLCQISPERTQGNEEAYEQDDIVKHLVEIAYGMRAWTWTISLQKTTGDPFVRKKASA